MSFYRPTNIVQLYVQARLLFSEYDTDGTGQITVNDLGKILLERTEADLGTQGVFHIEEDREVQQLLVWQQQLRTLRTSSISIEWFCFSFLTGHLVAEKDGQG